MGVSARSDTTQAAGGMPGRTRGWGPRSGAPSVVWMDLVGRGLSRHSLGHPSRDGGGAEGLPGAGAPHWVGEASLSSHPREAKCSMYFYVSTQTERARATV